MKAKDNKHQGLLIPQIPLITLIAVLLTLTIFTFHYASLYTTLWINIFNFLIDHGGRLVLGYFFFPLFFVLTLGFFGLLIWELVRSYRR